MGKGIWSNTPWDPTGGRARRGHHSISRGDVARLVVVGIALAIATGVAAWLTS